MSDRRVEQFDVRIARAVDKVLLQMGGGVPSLIWEHLQITHGMSRYDVVSRPDEFLRGIEEIFGASTRSRMEASMVGMISDAFGLESNGYTLATAISTARKARFK